MDWVTAISPSGDKGYQAGLGIVDRCSKTPRFLQYHKDNTAMDTAFPPWNRDISHTGLFRNFISDRDAKLTSDIWTNIYKLFGTKLSFSTAYHSQTHVLVGRMIQTLEDRKRRFCAHGLEFQDLDGFTHDW
ncbi:hypothetical protein O181_088019 [Austropuccinia psidii MF-1]|uniref:Uncharacterized protein n=1 Tax=Austropuccinia psidii MF-1 TaxID=1389203 RepID=A0A9Q3IQV8_9BASI|nr:hypothetical protein [Austropuccinia psidii MF-1]